MIGLLFIGCRNLQDWMALPVSKGLVDDQQKGRKLK